MLIKGRFRYFLTSLFLLLILLAAGCESNLNLEIPDSSPIITVNCILKDDESVSMKITKSLPYRVSSDTITIVRNASVKLINEDGFTDSLVYREYKDINQLYGAYVSLNSYKPVSDQSYEIRIKVPGFEEITSATIMPQPVPILSVDTNTTYLKNGSYSNKVLECTVRFKDPPHIKNYYKLSIDRFGLFKTCQSGPFGCTTHLIKYNGSFYSYDNNSVYKRINYNPPGLISFENEDEEIWFNEVFIADDVFDGSIYELKIFIRGDWFQDRANPPSGEKITYRTAYIRLYSINEEYYKYSKSYFDQLIKRNDLFSEPVQVYSNISNGIGIFSGASVTIDSSIIIPVKYSSFTH